MTRIKRAAPSRAGEFPLLIEQRNAVIAQDGGYVALPFEDRGIDPAPPFRLAPADPHRDVILHSSRARLVLERHQGERQVIMLAEVAGDRSPQKADVDRTVDHVL